MPAVRCSACHGTGVEIVGADGHPDVPCFVCYGGQMVDPQFVCRCGHPATWRHPELGLPYCGRIGCADAMKKGTH